ncbi:AraC family transcriptional regulator [Streptomyces gramineus]|uniref:AraC family transcriptional regulator n=1 Tax=Streptomyces gramineus TaxID=910542 RepID=UPI00398AF01A
MDSVSHLLRMAKVTASLDQRCLLGAATRMEVAERQALEAQFHVLLEGECRLQVAHTVLDMKPGDFVMIPGGAAHRIITPGTYSAAATTEAEGESFITAYSANGGTPVIDLFCGHYAFDPGAGAVLFRSLPDPVHVSFGASAETDTMLRTLSELMRGEARRGGAGMSVILSALSTVLLAMVLRSTRGSTTDVTLWTATTDPRVTETVQAVLADPGGDWSIPRLAQRAAMSRATFLRHFTRETGMTVGAFLVRTRMMTAAELLSSTDDTVATVAGLVGYGSESAFSRVFRSEIGVSPARFRRERHQRENRLRRIRTE